SRAGRVPLTGRRRPPHVGAVGSARLVVVVASRRSLRPLVMDALLVGRALILFRRRRRVVVSASPEPPPGFVRRPPIMPRRLSPSGILMPPPGRAGGWGL